MRQRLAAFLFLVVAAAAGSISAAGAISPIQPDNRPLPLPGITNGEVPASLLVQVAPNCMTARAAGPSLSLLFAEARAVGVSLGSGECYRALGDQVSARARATANGNAACAASVGTSPTGKPVGMSMHGWGKASDMTDAGRSLTFASPGYAFLKSAAAAVGWNHPGWAEPGGSTCPEPWHWEWVGDGGNRGLDQLRADVVALVPSAADAGYLTINGLGGVAPHGAAVDRGSVASIPIAWVVVGASPTPSRAGYWMVAGDGGVFSFGDAAFYGSTGGMRLNAPVLGMAPTATGRGYWLGAWDGGVFSFGDAAFHGSTGGMRLVRPMVGMTATPTGGGYWLVAADGGVFSFGDAAFYGSTGGLRLVSPVVGMAPTPSGHGYWLVATDGGVFSFGDAPFYGSAAGGSTSPVVGMVATQSGRGYWLQRADGQVQAFGDAPFAGNG